MMSRIDCNQHIQSSYIRFYMKIVAHDSVVDSYFPQITIADIPQIYLIIQTTESGMSLTQVRVMKF